VLLSSGLALGLAKVVLLRSLLEGGLSNGGLAGWSGWGFGGGFEGGLVVAGQLEVLWVV